MYPKSAKFITGKGCLLHQLLDEGSGLNWPSGSWPLHLFLTSYLPPDFMFGGGTLTGSTRMDTKFILGALFWQTLWSVPSGSHLHDRRITGWCMAPSPSLLTLFREKEKRQLHRVFRIRDEIQMTVTVNCWSACLESPERQASGHVCRRLSCLC